MVAGLIILGVVCILGGVLLLVLVGLNDGSSSGDPVERFFKKSNVIYLGILGGLLVMGGIGSIAGAVKAATTPATAGHHK